jgi:phosphate starvation-inducible PhoH-like protein
MSPRNTVRDREQGDSRLDFADNALAQQLYGAHHSHLARIEAALDVTIHARGNRLSFSGDGDQTATARGVVEDLYKRLERGLAVDREEVDAALRMAGRDETGLTIRTRKKSISPRSPKQAAYIRAMDDVDLVFGLGPAGTGKTYLAVAKAVEGLIGGEVDRIILSRPAVEAGENLGFLPGDLREKVDPYLRPLYDALYDMMPAPQVAKFLEGGEIEVAPLAFMRGRTLAHAFIILDEAQNTTAVQMKMLLTRMGENSRMVVTGDLTQVDLPRGTGSGLGDAVQVLERIPGVAFIHFSDVDVVRHGLVTRIVRAYDKADGRPGAGKGKKPR